MPFPVAVALGSNLGDRRAHLVFGVSELTRHLQNLRLSSIRETEPAGVPSPQPPYLNAAAIGETTLEPATLLETLLSIEQAAGRTRPAALAPRTLDLDLILFGDRIIETPALVVPHPRFRERRFVLEPLAEVAVDWRDPVSGKTVGELLEQLTT
jgi:2-amino-4-hydroxy-6-hydroxymethyldihydropteridine diphosphokinase